MGKIKITSTLKSSDSVHKFEGMGIKKDNVIIYKDDVRTKIVLSDKLIIERTSDYFIKLNLKEGINLKGKYITNYGEFDICSEAEKIEIKKNSVKAIYKLSINGNYIDTFEYYLKFSIDS